MRAGDLDRLITIQREVVVGDDGFGNLITEWVDLAVVWASVKQESGREFFAHQTIESERKITFRLRWIDGGVLTTDRVIYDDREHNIREVRELGRGEGLELHATSSG